MDGNQNDILLEEVNFSCPSLESTMSRAHQLRIEKCIEGIGFGPITGAAALHDEG
jgi:hypothetical protein